MSKRKINLEEIIRKHILMNIDYLDEYSNIHDVKNAMLEFGKQLLELAAENAKGSVGRNQFNPKTDICFIDKQSILDTIKQVE